jgi:glycosyltransferase involved in cell wall biosynthesis
MFRTTWAVFRAAVKEKAEVYHLHDVELIAVGMLLRLRGCKVIYDVHEDYPRLILSKYYIPARLRPLLAKVVEEVEDFAASRFSALVITTPHIAQRFQHLRAHVVVVQNFPLLHELVDDGRIIPWHRREEAVIYIGSMTIERSIREMIAAIDLVSVDRSVELHLAGTYSPAGLRDEVASLHGWKRVRELGFLDRRGVKRSLERVKAGLALFRPEPNYTNSYPNKMFEYMAVGIPVVASDFPLWREIVNESGCGLLVDPLDPRAIADAIAQLLDNPQEAEAMGQRGRRAVEGLYNWENEEKKLLALYEQLLSPGCL